MGRRHECPYDASVEEIPCGIRGRLCDRCKEDMANLRTDRLIQAIALAGFLAGNETAAKPDGKVNRKKLVEIAAYAPAALAAVLKGDEE